MSTKIYYNISDKNICLIADILNNGGTVLYPTESVWGLGCNALLDHAINKIYEIKKRSDNHPFISLIDQHQNISKYARNITKENFNKISNISPTPTIIYSNALPIVKHLSNEKNEIALRVTPFPSLKKLIKHLNAPLISTSANISGTIPQTNLSSIHPDIINKVDVILNFDVKLSGKPSSIIKINDKGNIDYIRK